MFKQILEKIEKSLKRSHLSDVTKERYKYCIIKYLKFVEKNKKSFNLESVIEYIEDLQEKTNYSAGTINDYRSAIKYLFEAVLDKGWNDRRIPRLKYYTPLPMVLSINEVKKLFKHTKDVMYLTIFTTMYSSGLRVSEAVNIKIKDIDSDRKTIYIERPKSGYARYANLSKKNLESLRKYYKKYWRNKFGKWENEDYIFCTYRKDVPITSKSVRKELKKAAKRAGIKKKVTPHTLRHSVAVHMLESGIDLVTIKNFLGHRSIISTCIYLRMANVKELGYENPFDKLFQKGDKK